MRRLLKNLTCSMNLTLEGLPPYDFGLTIHKPGGWPLLTPFEVFEQGTLWTVMGQASGELFGLKLRSAGTVEKPKISCKVYSHEELTGGEKRQLTETITWMLNLEEDTSGFYALAKSDPLVKVLVKDLYGMRNTKQPDIFSRLILAVTLQMAPITRSDQMMNLLIKEYGERVRFEGKEILYWPSAETIANATVAELEQKCKLGYRAKSLKSIAESIHAGFRRFRSLKKCRLRKQKPSLWDSKG